MKLALIITVSIFFSGLISKFFHFPFNAIIMMIGLFSMIVVMVMAAITRKFSPFNLIVGFTSILWLTSLLFSLKFWPFVTVLISIAGILTLLSLIIAIKKRQFKNLFSLFICIVLSITFYSMPTHTRYYLVSIKWNHEIESDFFSWDKYSWFLYKSGKHEEAMIASNKALRIAKEANDTYWINFISEHNSKIKNKNWIHFRK